MRSSRSSEGAFRRDWLFCDEGELWTIAYEGRLVRLKDAKGLRYLAHLLQHPGRRFHVSELMAVADARRAKPGADGAAERARKAVTNRIRQSVARIRAVHGALGLHLGNAVHTGTVCSYTPDRPARWSQKPLV